MSLKGEILTLLQNAPVTERRIGTNADWTPGGDFDIFSITGGPVRVTGMMGHVRVGCTGAALIPLISYYPIVTGIGSITGLATLAAGAAWPLDTMLQWNGTLAGPLAPTIGLGHGQAGPASVQSFVAGYIDLLEGIIRIVNATADATAEIDWYITYIRLTPASQLAPV